MKTLYFDCGMGAAGDMLMASLYEICPDKAGFLKTMNEMGLPGLSVEAEPAVKCGITGTHMKVTIHGEEEESVDVDLQEHVHDHAEQHDHDHHEHCHDHDEEAGNHHHHEIEAHTTMFTSPIMTTMMSTTSITLIPTRKPIQKRIPATHTIITPAWTGSPTLLNI